MSHSCLRAVQCVMHHDGCDRSTYGSVSTNDHFELTETRRFIDHAEEGGVSNRHQPPEQHHFAIADSGFLDANGFDLHPARGVPRALQRLIIIERHPHDNALAGDDTRARDTAIAAGMDCHGKLCVNYDDGYTVDDAITEFTNDGWECWRDLMPYDHANHRRHRVHVFSRPREEREEAAAHYAALLKQAHETTPVSACCSQVNI
jgi:hypothetical protein